MPILSARAVVPGEHVPGRRVERGEPALSRTSLEPYLQLSQFANPTQAYLQDLEAGDRRDVFPCGLVLGGSGEWRAKKCSGEQR
jgi:hypothetical protein